MSQVRQVFLLLALAGLAPAAGVVITVETLVDADVAEGQCSLREAIVAANTDAAYRECPAGSGSTGSSSAAPARSFSRPTCRRSPRRSISSGRVPGGVEGVEAVEGKSRL